MIKLNKTVVIVDSVERAVKFYTEKLAFDLVDLQLNEENNSQSLVYAHLRKGKCYIIFRLPRVEELAEFSFIKRCTNRCVGLYLEMKKGIDKYYQRCNKKSIQIISELKDQPYGHKTFSIKDPFGLKITFAQPIEGFTPKVTDFVGLNISTRDASGQPKKEAELLDEMIKYLKGFGVLRRASKKYSKLWLKSKK